VPGAGCVSSSDSADGTIIDNDHSDDAVTEEKIEPGAVSTNRLASGAVTSAKIADGTISSADLADNVVTTDKIADGNVVTSDLAGAAVTSIKIADGAVGATQLATSSVSSSQIVNGTITEVDISSTASLNADTLDGQDSSAFQPRVVIDSVFEHGQLDVATCATVMQISVPVSGAGTIVVDAAATVRLGHTIGTKDRVVLTIQTTPDYCPTVSARNKEITIPEELPSSNSYVFPIALFRVASISTSGTYTYYVNAEMSDGGSAFDDLFSLQLRAIFYPD